jgi:hypothetical protein
MSVKDTLRNAISTVTMIQIDATHLSAGVLKELEGRESFRDVDTSLNERIYTGDIFQAVLGEMDEETKLIGIHKMHPIDVEQLEALCDLSIHEYIQITNI